MNIDILTKDFFYNIEKDFSDFMIKNITKFSQIF